MKLQTLRLHGFKSFADRTTLDFREGVTAIIGSNGCGKSNIADAIRWVLGEQRASAVRGSKMEEVIFQGTSRRRPLNFAEASLLFDNQDGRVPIPQTEIEIARKVFREGGSEYSLNRNACRLKDVHNLLRDTGLGSNAYAVIESTMIDTLLSDRAEERRALFEEAAGIGKYKDSRRAAMRRLDAAEADLTRLEDLISEVESKVRSLSRQRRKAERHRELKKRRLDLEIQIARVELQSLEESLSEGETKRLQLDESAKVASASRAGAEAQIEERRIEAADLGRKRVEFSGRLDRVREELDKRQREALVADERRTSAQSRIDQLGAERANLDGRSEELERNVRDATSARESAAQAAEAERNRAEEKTGRNREVKERLGSARKRVEELSTRARDLARQIATVEGQRLGTERRRRDLEENQADARERLEVLEEQLTQLTDQTELWQSQADDVRQRAAKARSIAEELGERVGVLRQREQRAREEARAAEDRLSTLTSQVDAREALERSYEGFSPAVAAILASRERFPGVLGPFADYLEGRPDKKETPALEAYLGSLTQALVIEDLATARALRAWFDEEWDEGGSLWLLPIGAIRDSREEAADGGVWVDRLLSDVRVVSRDPLEERPDAGAIVGPSGDMIDARGVVRLADRGNGQGILSRRDALRALRTERAEALRTRDARLVEREQIRESLSEAEADLQRAEESRRVVESELKSAELDAAAHADRRKRLSQEQNSTQERLRTLAQATVGAGEQLEQLQEKLAELSAAVEASGGEEDQARAELGVLEAEWDTAREAEAELRVLLAQKESAFREAQQRLAAAQEARRVAEQRRTAIDREAEQLRNGLLDYSGIKDRTDTEIQTFFGERDELTGELALIDARLSEVDSELAELGERARTARRTETEASEERHRAELKAADARSRVERMKERLEVEWGRPYAALANDAEPIEGGDLEEWREELRLASEQLEGLGLVNMLALEEHEEEQRRLDFLMGQRDDLVESRDNLVAAIREINKTAREVFQGTFDTVRKNFARTFESLFHGGECDVWLTDPDDPLESTVEIQASPEGKKTQRIHLLSGGERTLTALALLFALYLVKPSPFCVLDEIDAPLDESNVGRFIQLLHDFKHETQFVVITHNPRTMEAADWVYGVTMEEPGISSIVGVELLDAWTADNDVTATA